MLLVSVFFLLIPHAFSLNFSFTSFQQSHVNLNISLEPDAVMAEPYVYLVQSQTDQSQNNSQGRATYAQAMHLWDKTTGKLANFNTKFTFVINSEGRNEYGDGLTFFLAPEGSKLPNPPKVGGGSMGLIIGGHETLLNSTDHPFVAVEFDIYPNIGDDDGWDPPYLPEWVIFGFSAATGAAYASHRIDTWSFNSEVFPNVAPTPSKSRNDTALGIGLGVVVCFLVGVVIWFFLRRNITNMRSDEADENTINAFEGETGPKNFSYDELARATNDFEEEQKLGEGGFGCVYKGCFRDSNSYVAIKKISKDSKQGEEQFSAEVKIMSKLSHRNLVPLIGWCHRREELLLVYEYMPQGSLDYHLYKDERLMTWSVRFNIVQGLASALLYLHEELNSCVLHRDIKSSNIMLDSTFNTKLGDFGLARLVDHAEGKRTTAMAGTLGYMAPECATGRASKETDVYSFGVVALEIGCGKKPIILLDPKKKINIVEWVWDLYGSGRILEAVDSKLEEPFDKNQAERLLIVGLRCAHPDQNCRPSIRRAIQELNFETPFPDDFPSSYPIGSSIN
ncbi:hypothetical protein K1719_018608 [Acacia pycnantha]|nr:hypothetical protein K1719_018608 [Acacia pycnantha]